MGRANPSGLHALRSHTQLLSPNGVGSTYHHPRQGVGHRDLSRPRDSEQSSTSTTASLGRNRRRKQGVVLSYVTSFLRVRGPGVSQPSPLGRGWGRGRRFLPCLCCLSRPRQISGAGLLPKRPSSKEAPPARELGTKKGCCCLSMWKQQPAGFPNRKPGPELLIGTLGQRLRERGLGPSTTPTHAPGFLPHVLPTSS